MATSGEAHDSPAEPGWVREVLRFWFEELSERQWFRGGAEVDARVRARFAGLYERLASEPAPDAPTPDRALATVVALDQFSRNLFRDDARAFAADPLARRIARAAIDRRLDEGMDTNQRLFLYLPFEHSEAIEDQRLALELMQRLGDPRLLAFARDHHDVIARFGRFPHRNAVLGRESTPEELEYLKHAGGWAGGGAA